MNFESLWFDWIWGRFYNWCMRCEQFGIVLRTFDCWEFQSHDFGNGHFIRIGSTEKVGKYFVRIICLFCAKFKDISIILKAC